MPFTHAEQQALVLLDGAEASQKTRHHDNAAESDDEVGGGERRERGRQGGEAALRHRQPQAHAQEAAAAELKRAHRKLRNTSCRFSDNTLIGLLRPIYHDVTAGSSGTYPKEQVEEKQHVFNAADAATSHDGIARALQEKGLLEKLSRVINSLDCCYSSGQQLNKTLKQTLVSCSQWFSAFYLQT